jgi:hypothetical protein
MRWFDIPDELLPPVYKKIKDVYAYARSLDTELREFLIYAKRILDNFFIQRCDLQTIEYWEELLNIRLYGDETIDERRQNILLYLNNSSPTTEPYVRAVLTRLFGEENYSLYFDVERNKPYDLYIDIRDTDLNSINKFLYWFSAMCPAHIQWNAGHTETADTEFEIFAGSQSDYDIVTTASASTGTETLYLGSQATTFNYIEV